MRGTLPHDPRDANLRSLVDPKEQQYFSVIVNPPKLGFGYCHCFIVPERSMLIPMALEIGTTKYESHVETEKQIYGDLNGEKDVW